MCGPGLAARQCVRMEAVNVHSFLSQDSFTHFPLITPSGLSMGTILKM